MREFLNVIDNIYEAASLAPAELLKYDWRFEKFIEKIANKEPFVDLDGNQVIVYPDEANRLTNLKQNNQLKGAIFVHILNPDNSKGPQVPLSKLKKTADLQKIGGVLGQETKEHLLLKPKIIGITDKKIPASQLLDQIVNNSVLQSTEYGRVVIDLAQKIARGEPVVMPQQYQSKENAQILKGIVDYAGEYLGVLALVMGQSKFADKSKFLEWLGGDLEDLELNFPAASNTNLADSFASVTNTITNHTLNISSKGTGGGAAPAISGLKIPESLTSKQSTAIEFIKICQNSDRSGGPTTITSAFDAIDLIYRTNPKSLPNELVKLLPFDKTGPQLKNYVIDQIANKDMTPLADKYQDIVGQVNSKTATDGGKLVYFLKNAVCDAINNNSAIPEFASTILQILEMNFIQQYADYNKGVITFETQWPAKLKGSISVQHKSSATSPKDGGFSFKLGRPEIPDADQDLGLPGSDDNAASIARQQELQQKIADINKPIQGLRPKRVDFDNPPETTRQKR